MRSSTLHLCACVHIRQIKQQLHIFYYYFFLFHYSYIIALMSVLDFVNAICTTVCMYVCMKYYNHVIVLVLESHMGIMLHMNVLLHSLYTIIICRHTFIYIIQVHSILNMTIRRLQPFSWKSHNGYDLMAHTAIWI